MKAARADLVIAAGFCGAFGLYDGSGDRDFPGLALPAAMALFRRGVADGFYPLERPVYLALWLIPTFGMMLNRLDLPAMPLIVLLFGAITWKRLQTAAKVELPSAAAAR